MSNKEVIERNLKELGFGYSNEPAKTKRTQAVTPNVVQTRDLFQTPRYAVDLLVPFLPANIKRIWEPATGQGRLADRLETQGFEVFKSDLNKLREDVVIYNFLLEYPPDLVDKVDGIITNPPFSLKKEFYERCMQYGKPFALLIPADYSGWLIRATMEGAEKIIPTRRIDYITPSGKSGEGGHTADFHSMWLTWGLNLGRTETFVELSLDEKKGNI